MFIYAVFIIQALAYLTSGHPVSSRHIQAVNCESYTYNDIVLREFECQGTYRVGSLDEHIDRLDQRDWTGAELLAGLKTVCSLNPPSPLVNYVKCTSQLAPECPNLSADVMTAIRRKVDIFCDSGHVASWLLEALSLVNQFEAVCLAEVLKIPNFACNRAAIEQLPSNFMNATLTSILATSGEAFRQFYSCSRTSLMSPQFITDSQCTRTWQEVSFGLALYTLGIINVGFGLPEDVMTTILQDLHDLK